MKNKKYILADSGSTKTNWVLIEDGKIITELSTAGINPYVTDPKTIVSIISQLKEVGIYSLKDCSLFFYGAGCTDQNTTGIIEKAIEKTELHPASVFIGSDLLAAGRSLFGKKKGIACILGTGSSSGLMNNGFLTDEIPALGYVLGDEGGGVDIGKRLLVSILKRDAPESLINDFQGQFKLTKRDILNKIYFEASPNKYMASFMPFIQSHIGEDYVRSIVIDSFSLFIRLNVMKYEDFREIPIGFTGSVAFYFRDILREVLDDYKLIPGPVDQNPMEGLRLYHLNL